jgi:putative transposase
LASFGDIILQYDLYSIETNTVEGYHRQVRKVTKNKGVFPSDTALEKLVYLAYRDISGKWTMPLSNWALISQQLAIKFGDRFKIM